MAKRSEEDSMVTAVVRIVVIVLLVILFIILHPWYSVNEQQNAVVTQFGKVIKTSTAGLYGRLPWQAVHKVDMTTHGTGIGYVVSPEGQNITDTDNGIMITSDFNLLNIDFYMEYRVSDPVAFLYNSEDPEAILSNVAMSNIRTVVSNYTVDEAMTTGKSKIQSDIKEAMLKELAERNIGLTVVNITIQDSAPPTDAVVQAFKGVETAKQQAETAKNNALQYQNEQIPKADADADKIIQQANATKEGRIAEAEGQVARFNETYAEYQKFPLVTKRRMFYEKMEKILPTLKVIITDGNTQTMLPLESFSGSSTVGTTVPQTTVTETTEGTTEGN